MFLPWECPQSIFVIRDVLCRHHHHHQHIFHILLWTFFLYLLFVLLWFDNINKYHNNKMIMIVNQSVTFCCFPTLFVADTWSAHIVFKQNKKGQQIYVFPRRWLWEQEWNKKQVRGPQMGGEIRRGWIWRFWGAPIFRPEAPNPFKIGIWGPLDWKSGRPKNAKSYHDGSDPPFAALWTRKIVVH